MEEATTKLHNAAIDCLVKVGLIASVIARFPEEVQENFKEKVEELTHTLETAGEEFVLFGESYDDHLEGTTDDD